MRNTRIETLLVQAVSLGVMPIFTTRLLPPYRGMYWPIPYAPVPIIFLDMALKGNVPLLLCVLAEEIGHHVTGSVGPAWESYVGNLSSRLRETPALEWAYEALMPAWEVNRLLQPGGKLTFHWNTYRLARYFEVTPEFARARVLDMAARSGLYWRDVGRWLAAEEMEPFPAPSDVLPAMTV